MEYKISVIIPVYNAEKTLERAVDSVMKQTLGFENIELLLCDDCSTDGSFALIRKYAAEHPNIKALRTEKNSGAAGAPRNLGLDAATASYIMFLDEDDAFEEWACAELYRAIDSSKADLAWGSYTIIDDAGEHEGEKIKNAPVSAGFHLLSENPSLYPSLLPYIWDKIFCRALLEQYSLRFVEASFAEDDVFVLLYMSAVRNVAIITDCIVRHFISSSLSSHISLMIRQKGWWRTSTCISYTEMLRMARDMGIKENFDRALSSTGVLVYVLECMLKKSECLEQGELERILRAWQPVFSYAYANDLNLHTAASKIIFRDLHEEDYDKALYDFSALRALYQQRQTELDSIFSSTTWKIASGLQKLKFWSK